MHRADGGGALRKRVGRVGAPGEPVAHGIDRRGDGPSLHGGPRGRAARPTAAERLRARRPPRGHRPRSDRIRTLLLDLLGKQEKTAEIELDAARTKFETFAGLYHRYHTHGAELAKAEAATARAQSNLLLIRLRRAQLELEAAEAPVPDRPARNDSSNCGPLISRPRSASTSSRRPASGRASRPPARGTAGA